MVRLALTALVCLVFGFIGYRAVSIGMADFLLKPASFRVKEGLSSNPKVLGNSVAALPNGQAWFKVVNELDHAEQLDPSQASIKHQLALAYMARANAFSNAPAVKNTYYDIAKAYLEEAQALNPLSAYITQNLILVRAALGLHNFETAQLFIRFNELGPRERSLQNSLLLSYAPAIASMGPEMQQAYFQVFQQAQRVNRQGLNRLLVAQAKRVGACAYVKKSGASEIWHPSICMAIKQ